MTRITWTALLTLAMIFATTPSIARGEKSPRVPYNGHLQNENMGPIAGIYPIKFSLYKTRKGRRAVWSENTWVAVENGRYSVEIGGQKKLPRKLKLERLFLGVEIAGVGEILRERLIPRESAFSETQPTGPEVVASPAREPTSSNPTPQGSAVDVAMLAYEAEYAKNSAKLNNMDVEELKKYVYVPVKLGTNTRNTGAAGGSGGYEFNESCPRGYVVTGMRGAAGKYLDSLSLICSPLE